MRWPNSARRRADRCEYRFKPAGAFAPALFGNGIGPGAVTIQYRHGGTAAQQRLDRCPADARCATGDYCHLARKCCAHALFSCEGLQHCLSDAGQDRLVI